jgi:RNA polymerase sigma factor (sigma-70 family)
LDRVPTNCRCITRSPDDAPDLAQDVFIKLFHGLSCFEGRAPVSTWIYRVKVNHCLNYLRKLGGPVHVSTDDEERVNPETQAALSVEPAAERRADRKDTQRRILDVLDALPETLRLPLVMREIDQMAYQEIADQFCRAPAAAGAGLPRPDPQPDPPACPRRRRARRFLAGDRHGADAVAGDDLRSLAGPRRDRGEGATR